MYRGYVLKNEFVKFYGEDNYRSILGKIFLSLDVSEDWSYADFIRFFNNFNSYGEKEVWCLISHDAGTTLTGWHLDCMSNNEYYYVKPEEFVNKILGEEMNKEIKVAKPRFHKKRKPVPVRKKTDITVYYSTGEKYTIKNVKALCVKGDTICIGLTPEVKNGYFEGNSFGFTTGNVDSFLVKTPKGSYTLDSVGDNEFILTQEGSVMTLTELNQTF